jgi:hypothetical protein
MHGSDTMLLATSGRSLWTADFTPQGSTLACAAISDKTVQKLSTISFQLPVTDSFGAYITYSMSSIPANTGATLGPDGVFHWTPQQGQQNQTYTFTVTVSDDYGSQVQRTFHVFVQDVNLPPFIPDPGTILATPGGTVSYSLVATDPDVPAQHLTPAIPHGVTWVTWNGTTLTVSPPISTKAGNYPITMTVTDNGTPTKSYARSILIHVAPATIKSLAFAAPGTVEGGSPATLIATLASPAPHGGTSIALSAKSTLFQPPATIVVPEGQLSASVQVPTSMVASPSNVSLTGGLGTTLSIATLRILPPNVVGISLNPTTVSGGTNSTATVTISRPAPTGGVLVQISSSAVGVANVPTSVLVPAGQTQASFTITTHAVFGTPTATIKATTNGNSVSAVLIVTF